MEHRREDVRQKRAEWRDWQQQLQDHDVRDLVFLDESSVDNTAFSRKYGRAYEGRRVYGQFPKAKQSRVSVLVAVGWEGVLAYYTVPGSFTGKDFAFFMMHCLTPVIENKHKTIIMDNAKIHHAVPEVQLCYEYMGHNWRYLPPYSPDFNPVENVFSKMKVLLTHFRIAALRDPMLCIVQVIPRIFVDNIQNWYHLCGYKIKN